VAEDLARRCPLLDTDRVLKANIHYGFRKMKLPCSNERLWLVVVAGFGEQPLMLLTTQRMEHKRQRLWWMIEAYLTLWRIEDTIRFVKQSYQIEDFRVLTYERLRNIIGLVLSSSYFAAVYLGYELRWRYW
jgi:hypothetical protein